MDFESNDLRPVDYVLFALAFVAQMIAFTGVILSSPAIALTGLFILLFSLLCYWVALPEEI